MVVGDTGCVNMSLIMPLVLEEMNLNGLIEIEVNKIKVPVHPPEGYARSKGKVQGDDVHLDWEVLR